MARPLRGVLLLSLLALAGCSTGRGSVPLLDGPPVDGLATTPDGGVPDGRVPDSVPAITEIDCNLDCKDFVVSRLILPEAATASKVGADLDGDGAIDNALGSILGALAGVSSSMSLQQELDGAVYGGDAVMLIRLQAASFTNAPSSVAQAWRGESQTCCTDPKDLVACEAEAAAGCYNGNHTFTPHPTDDYSTILGGSITAGAIRYGPSKLTLALKISGGSTLDLNLLSVYLLGTLDSPGIADGVIAGALPKAELDSKVIPAITDILNDELSDPSTPQSTIDTILSLFDSDGDKVIAVSEVQNNALIETFLAGDVDVDKDGEKELSLGIGFEAVPAVIQKP
jgi:hypothetical protein